ncbi:TatD family hydrolase [Planosporangium mesophilum]|uniref:AraC family transcriptional regulator n=1 Tax=Planosporangium mesophilum TaxID=689768 RepID=A0A8J3T7G0_9ACTN|nr:TatD family hydrolase [Planosporangium mesophilum]NJC81103.1 TatD family hydrolase [Planosporangium mesophilum]GII21249.1 AraC family transcriptional regulator [Planosporangium mesophilum]
MSNQSPSERRKTKAAQRAGEFPPPPEPLPAPVIDSHTHLDITLNEGGTDGPDSVEAAIAMARAVGVDRLVQVGVDVDSSRWGVEVARKYPAVVATVALHPNDAPRVPDLDAALREIEALAAEERVRGIGETGLDTFRTGEEGRAAQEASFRAHIGFAKRYGKALVIHDRDAHADVLRVLDSEGAPDTVVLHCFSGDAEFAAECVRRGYVLSFAGTVTFGNAGALREAAAVTPSDQLLVETDAPFLTPTPYRGRPNASYLIPLTVRALAEVKGADLDELCAAISATGDRVFGPW